MSRQRVAIASLLAVFAASMFTTAVASAAGPFWHRNGAPLEQKASVGVSGQNKGNLTLKSTVAGITISCTTSNSKGTIESQGATLQGQGKGIVKYEHCTVVGAETSCQIAEKDATEKPGNESITTRQLKIHLATATVQSKEQIVALFEPAPNEQSTEKIFTKFAIVSKPGETCLIAGPYTVKGSVVAQLSPQEAESQEGSLFFPEPAITTITHEGQTVHPELHLGSSAAVFTGYYGQKAQTGTFGVFRT
jgi:hypothetical protein